MRNEFTIVTALSKQMLRVRLLKIIAADFVTGDLRGKGEHRNTASVTVIKAVDQVQVAWAATSGAHGQLAREMGLCTRGEGGGFFVSHVNPSNLGLRSNRVGDSIQRVARESINALNASTRESLNQQFRNVHSHRAAPFPLLRYNSALSPGGHRHRPLAKVANHHLSNHEAEAHCRYERLLFHADRLI
jgi:hypothetical protein